MIRTPVALAVAIAILAAAPLASGQGSDGPRWKRILAKSLVSVQDGEFRYSDSALCEFKPQEGWAGTTRTLQLRSIARAPADGTISRDMFVMWVSHTEADLVSHLAASGSSSCQNLDHPIGSVDIELVMTFTREGFQVEVTNAQTGRSNRRTQTWADTYPER